MAVGVWDKQTKSKWREFRGHTRSVKCVEWMTGTDTQFATGARGDNTVMVWDTRDRRDTVPDNAIRRAHSMVQGVKNKNEATCNPLPSPLPRAW
jgi:WD40 repeat protein